jgi:hypothetical protein
LRIFTRSTGMTPEKFDKKLITFAVKQFCIEITKWIVFYADSAARKFKQEVSSWGRASLLIKQNLKFLNETFDVPNTFNKASWIWFFSHKFWQLPTWRNFFFCKNLRATELCNVLYLIRTQIWSAFRNVSCVTHPSKGYRKVQGSD